MGSLGKPLCPRNSDKNAKCFFKLSVCYECPILTNSEATRRRFVKFSDIYVLLNSPKKSTSVITQFQQINSIISLYTRTHTVEYSHVFQHYLRPTSILIPHQSSSLNQHCTTSAVDIELENKHNFLHIEPPACKRVLFEKLLVAKS